VTTRRTPLFDEDLGFVYNVQSVTMFVAPLTYALGAFVAMSAHHEIQRVAPINNFGADDFQDPTLNDRGDAREAARQPASHRGQPPPVQPFQGHSYKLQDSEA